MNPYRPEQNFLGGFTPNDGTIAFYSRIKALVRSEDTVLDLGAGRAAWYEDDICLYRRHIRTLKGSVRELIAADVDRAVLLNRASDRNIIIDGKIPLPDHSVDIIIADYVLEHVENPELFVSEIRRILKPSGFFCARTPHKYNYVSIGARFFANRYHKNYLKHLQPDRKTEDIFPTSYKINTLGAVENYFFEFENYSYILKTDPAYFLGNRIIYKILNVIHKIIPKQICGNILLFLQYEKSKR